MDEERTKTADAGLDHFLGFGVQADFARQGQKPQRLVEVDGLRVYVFGHGRAFGLGLFFLGGLLFRGPFLLASAGLGGGFLYLFRFRLFFGNVGRRGRAKLHVGAVGAEAQRDDHARFRVFAQFLGRGAFGRAFVGGAVPACQHGARVAAIGVAGAADESAELAELERQRAFLALRAFARIGSFFGEEDGLEVVFKSGDDVGYLEVRRFADRFAERRPEIAENRFPFHIAGRDAVELFFEIGGEVVFDVLLEEVYEEGRDNTPAAFRYEAAVVELHVFAVLQHLQDGGVG